MHGPRSSEGHCLVAGRAVAAMRLLFARVQLLRMRDLHRQFLSLRSIAHERLTRARLLSLSFAPQPDPLGLSGETLPELYGSAPVHVRPSGAASLGMLGEGRCNNGGFDCFSREKSQPALLDNSQLCCETTASPYVALGSHAHAHSFQPYASRPASALAPTGSSRGQDKAVTVNAVQVIAPRDLHRKPKDVTIVCLSDSVEAAVQLHMPDDFHLSDARSRT
jgi:hypothetical protein